MIAMMFEVWPKPHLKQGYLDEAARLRQLVDEVDGFLSIERFESLSEPGKLLSLGFFRDEEAIHAWRNTPAHRAAQSLGRAKYFNDYRLRIAKVSRDYSMTDRDGAPQDSVTAHGSASQSWQLER